MQLSNQGIPTGDEMKKVLRLMAAPVSIVTMNDSSRKHGLTISSFTCISINPAIMAIAIDRNHSANSFLYETGRFAINVLSEEQNEISNRFAYEKNLDRFQFGNWVESPNGLPVLEGVQFWFDCKLINGYDQESHTIFLGSVEHFLTNDDKMPLVYWNGGYKKIER